MSEEEKEQPKENNGYYIAIGVLTDKPLNVIKKQVWNALMGYGSLTDFIPPIRIIDEDCDELTDEEFFGLFMDRNG
jgi:hypothetical protein